jgi:nicotinate-nucleotide adenylyltransferase
MHHPRIHVTGFETAHGLRYTYETLKFLKTSLPARRFVWIMGTDNFADFDHWQRWREIAGLMPMAIYARPGSTLRAPLAKAGTALARYRIDETDAGTLAYRLPPAWVFLSGLMSGISSTQIRAARGPASPLA